MAGVTNQLNTPFPGTVAKGFTGRGSLTPYAVIIGGNISSDAVNFVTIGNSGYFLMDQGAGNPPVFAALPASVSPAELQDQTYTYFADSGAANAYAITAVPSLGAYADGQAVEMKAANPNTTASTLNANAIGAAAIVTAGNNALIGGEILANVQYSFIYNSTYSAWVLQNSSLVPTSGLTQAQVLARVSMGV